MKKAISSRIADISAKCIARAASASASAACGIYFYQPKTPKNLNQRLKK
jgi:cyclic lactone autoinducer peptide